ncbi:MAG: hypothetical protein K8R36_19930 [Planctomycetales bacterium]|nr:hypothetical protein [Planctomycetales bacterium]
MLNPLWLRMTAAWGILSIASIAQAYERPVLILAGLPGGAKVSTFSNLSIGGRIEPIIEGGVEVRFFSVLKNGTLQQLGGTTGQINHTGTFAVSLFPPKTGWLPGKVRAKVTFTLIKQVKAETEFEIVTQAGVPAVPFGEDKPPLDIGRIVDLTKNRGETVKVPAHSRFYIRGIVAQPNKKFVSENGVAGPTVFGDIIKEETAFFNGITVSLAEKDRKGVYSYEMEVVSPHKAGLYSVRLTPMIFETGEAMEKAFAREEAGITIEVEGDVDLSR